MKKMLIVMAAVAILSLSAFTQDVSEAEAKRIKTRYPSSYEVKIPAGTKLAVLAMKYERLGTQMAESDREDEGAYPLWYRAYLRENFPELPTKGQYQYPRVAAQILEWMLTHPNFEVPPAKKTKGSSKKMAPSRTMSVGTNVNLTNLNERNSESFIAVDYSNPQNLIAGSNNISGSGRQKQFWSTDGGTTWSSTELPLAAGTDFQSDPAVAW
ncbi:MAG: hypothetical protein KAT34_19410, partial [Candidatus Aminicenantes bacterium]|nr:hypothetical protein [Candidatus Aminicenantes bacterium]